MGSSLMWSYVSERQGSCELPNDKAGQSHQTPMWQRWDDVANLTSQHCHMSTHHDLLRNGLLLLIPSAVIEPDRP